MARHRSGQVRQHVQGGKRRETQERAIAQIFQLTASYGILGVSEVEAERCSSGKVQQHFKAESQAIEEPADFEQRGRKFQDSCRGNGHQC